MCLVKVIITIKAERARVKFFILSNIVNKVDSFFAFKKIQSGFCNTNNQSLRLKRLFSKFLSSTHT